MPGALLEDSSGDRVEALAPPPLIQLRGKS
jgi:hypothetical protein